MRCAAPPSRPRHRAGLSCPTRPGPVTCMCRKQSCRAIGSWRPRRRSSGAARLRPMCSSRAVLVGWPPRCRCRCVRHSPPRRRSLSWNPIVPRACWRPRNSASVPAFPAISTPSWRGWPVANRAHWRGRNWSAARPPSWQSPTRRRWPPCGCWRRRGSSPGSQVSLDWRDVCWLRRTPWRARRSVSTQPVVCWCSGTRGGNGSGAIRGTGWQRPRINRAYISSRRTCLIPVIPVPGSSYLQIQVVKGGPRTLAPPWMPAFVGMMRMDGPQGPWYQSLGRSAAINKNGGRRRPSSHSGCSASCAGVASGSSSRASTNPNSSSPFT